MSLAPTAFLTGVDETLVTVDAYKLDSATSALDTAQDLQDEFDPNDLEGLLGGNLGDPSALVAGVDEAQGLLLDPAAVKNNLIASVQGATDMLSSVGASVAGAITEVAGSVVSQIEATVNGVSAMISQANLSTISGVASLIGAVSGAPFPISLSDNAGLTTLATNLVKQACTLGIPGAYTQMAAGLANNQPMLTKVTQGVLGTVASCSNLGMLGEIANGPLGAAIGKISPGFVASFAGAFTLPAGSNSSGMANMGVQMFSSFNTLQPDWNKTTPLTTRNPYAGISATRPTTNSASTVLTASPDFKRVVGVCANSTVLPVVTQPTVIKIQKPEQLLDPALEFPAGTTSLSSSNPDGTSTTIYTYPDGTTCSRLTSADHTKVTSVYDYPAQGLPAPHASDAYRASIEPVTYASSFDTRNLPPLDVSTINPADYDQTSFGVGARAVGGTLDDGSTVTTVTTANGSTYTRRVDPDGVVESVMNASTHVASYTGPADPMANWAATTAANPVVMSAVMVDVQSQDQQWAKSTASRNGNATSSTSSLAYSSSNTTRAREVTIEVDPPLPGEPIPAYLSMDASQALSASFPQTNVSDDW